MAPWQVENALTTPNLPKTQAPQVLAFPCISGPTGAATAQCRGEWGRAASSGRVEAVCFCTVGKSEPPKSCGASGSPGRPHASPGLWGSRLLVEGAAAPGGGWVQTYLMSRTRARSCLMECVNSSRLMKSKLCSGCGDEATVSPRGEEPCGPGHGSWGGHLSTRSSPSPAHHGTSAKSPTFPHLLCPPPRLLAAGHTVARALFSCVAL